MTEINGADRYARNIAIVSAFKDSLDFSTIYLATGENFADALSGSVLAGINGNPLILVGSDITNEENLLQLVAPNATIKVLGGIGSVPDDTVIGIDNPITPITVDPISPIPTNVEATIGSNGVVNITWYPIDNVNSYKVYYSIDNVSYTSTDNLRVYENFIHIDLDDISALSKIIDKPIYFKVTSILSGKESAFSSYTSVIPAVISTIPTGVRASWGGDDIVNLGWNLVGTKNSYNVYYSTDNVTYTNTGNTNGSGMFLHLNYIPKLSGIKNKIIYFKVTSVLNGIESVFSSCSAVFIGKITVDTSDLNVSQIDFISTQLTKTGDATATLNTKY